MSSTRSLDKLCRRRRRLESLSSLGRIGTGRMFILSRPMVLVRDLEGMVRVVMGIILILGDHMPFPMRGLSGHKIRIRGLMDMAMVEAWEAWVLEGR